MVIGIISTLIVFVVSAAIYMLGDRDGYKRGYKDGIDAAIPRG